MPKDLKALKSVMAHGDELVSAICKSAAQLKATVDKNPKDADSIRILSGELADQSTALLAGWHAVQTDMQIVLDDAEAPVEAHAV